jgi:hypothetical protein
MFLTQLLVPSLTTVGRTLADGGFPRRTLYKHGVLYCGNRP